MIRAALALLVLAGPSAAAECSDIDHEGTLYSLCEVNPARDDLRLFLLDADGTPYGDFDAVNAALAAEGKTLGFAMNAGMYHADRAPVGHYVEDGTEIMRVIPNAGPGNFGMLPNGVLCIRPDRADVFETLDFIARAPDCQFATQSGPMLVIDGELHPRFLPDSTSRFIRNGAGTNADGDRAVFVMSRAAVTFHEFASLFRDRLGLPNALYFDGNISRIYAPQIGKDDPGRRMGPIVGTVIPAQRP